MTIKKIILSTVVFGFAACNMLAMENLEKLTIEKPHTRVFLNKTPYISGTSKIRYEGPAWYIADKGMIKLRPQFQKYRFFGSKFAIEKAIAENNFVSCDFSDGAEAIVCNTTDKRACYYAEELDKLLTRELLVGNNANYDVHFTPEK